MIKELSESIAGWLEKEGAVSGDNCSLFAYAVYSLFFGLMPIVIVSGLGIAFGMVLEGLLMILPFMIIRKFSGGYHLNSPGQCIIFSCILLTMALSTVSAFTHFICNFLLTVLVSFSVLILFLFSPISNEARELLEKEKVLFRKVARILSISAFVIYMILSVTAPPNIYVPIGVGIILPAVLQLPCIVKHCFL